MSDNHAPNGPPVLRTKSLFAVCDQPGSSGWKVNRISAKYPPNAAKNIHDASRNKRATLGEMGSAGRAMVGLNNPNIMPI